MVFVEEKISDEDRKIVDSFGFIDPVDKELSKPRYWKIDSERNAFLVCIGGGKARNTCLLRVCME